MPKFMDLELANACYKLMHDLIQVKKGESVLITVDSKAEFRVVEEMAKAAEVLGAKTMVAWHSTPKGYGALTMPYLPEPLIACVDKTDVWVEMNDQWLLYSPIWDKAVTNGRTRQVMLGGLSVERIVRCIGEVDLRRVQRAFPELSCAAMTKQAKEVRITNGAGTECNLYGNRPKPPRVANECDYSFAGGHFLLGQIGWAPKEDTIHGVIAFDSAPFPEGGEAELGKLAEPVRYIVKEGRIQEIQGGEQADILRAYYKKLDDPNMYIAAHVCYGVNPNARAGGCTTG
ncbi:MAG: leucyl aminopeptidase [Enterocloster sp.]